MSVYLEGGKVVLRLRYPDGGGSSPTSGNLMEFTTVSSDYARGHWFKVKASNYLIRYR